MKRPYICGPMTGLENNNYDRFAYLLRALRDIGLDPQSPHLLEANIPNTAKAQMDRGMLYKMVIPGDIYMLSTCDAAIALPFWHESEGTGFELAGAGLFRQPIHKCWKLGMGHTIGKDGLNDEFKHWVDGVIEEVTCEHS